MVCGGVHSYIINIKMYERLEKEKQRERGGGGRERERPTKVMHRTILNTSFGASLNKHTLNIEETYSAIIIADSLHLCMYIYYTTYMHVHV